MKARDHRTVERRGVRRMADTSCFPGIVDVGHRLTQRRGAS
jgi:hypothetical protein